MKKILKVLLILLAIFSVGTVYAESSRFSPKVSIKDEELDKSNYFYLVLSYNGESVNQVELEVSYNGRFLEFIDATALNDYKLDSGTIMKDGRYRKVKIESKFDQDYDTTEFAVLTFRVLDTFKIGKDSFIELKDYRAASSDGVSKYMYDGIEVAVNRETLNKVTISYQDLNNESKIRNTISEYLTRFFMVAAIIGIIILLIVILPTKRDILKTHREREASKKVSGRFYTRDNYRFNIDEIRQIGEKPKEEPKNKLELGEFDPFKENVAKREDAKFDASRDFRAVDVSVFNNKPNLVDEKAAKEEKVEELTEMSAKKSTKKGLSSLFKSKKTERKNVKEGKDGLIMINSKKLDDANKDDLD